MASITNAVDFDETLGCLISSDLDELATQLTQVTELSHREREILLDAARESLNAVLHAKLSRLLLLELNAARVTGRLTGLDSAERWDQFVELSSRADFWEEMSSHYPPVLARIARIVRNRCATALKFALCWARDRASLFDLCGDFPGELKELNFGAGDTHHSGQTVAHVRCQTGPIMYKPRSMAVDAALHHFISQLADDADHPLLIRVPQVVAYETHGWAEFIPHRYASGGQELSSFYRGIGHWLAIMRLLGGSDLHAENLIADLGSPVVVDCETLFTPRIPPFPSGLGQAVDYAMETVAGTVLNIGLLPGRGQGLGWHGVDTSAVGSLPGEQPMLPQPTILKSGTDEAHLGTAMVQVTMSQNHPSPQPALARYWPAVLDGFDEMTSTLQRLDATAALRPRLEPFAYCQIRVVPRATEVYAEVARMLWHPVSLHKEAPARARAHALLARMADNVSSAPSDPAVIEAEIEDLLHGDIPVFTTSPRCGQLDGPRGTRWLAPCDLVEAAWQHWRAADIALERNVIQAALVSAYINDGWMPDDVSLLPEVVRHGDLDSRRRRQAAGIVRNLVQSGIKGRDGSVAWIAPVFGQTGWSVQPIEQDLYGGTSGVALLAGAYLTQAKAGRAEPVDGLEDLFGAALHTLELAEAKLESQRRKSGVKIRPSQPGGYVGLGSQIWTHLALTQMGLEGPEGLQRACALAAAMPEAAAADEAHDVFSGNAGAIPPLLLLAHKTGDERYLRMASEIGDLLCERAQRKDGQAYWTHSRWPEGIGGFAHGASGVGWALTKLSRVTGKSRHWQTATAAFAFEDALFDSKEQNWTDLRMLEGAKTAAAWCHGSVGIGLSRLSLDPQLAEPNTRLVLRQAATATWRLGLGWTHSTCHGDLGAWELLDHAVAAGEGPNGLTREGLLELILTSIEDHGPISGVARDVFSPGLMSGLGGVAYQLLRADPSNTLPSILSLSGGGL
jgi:class II lanthipeptide synthase